MSIFGWSGNFDPMGQLRRVGEEIERLIEQGAGKYLGGTSYPAVVLLETETEYLISAQLVGVRREDIELTLTGETLTLRGEKKAPPDYDRNRFLRRERGFGRFNRNIVLPGPVEQNSVEAVHNAGVLTVRLKRSDAEKPKVIPVKLQS